MKALLFVPKKLQNAILKFLGFICFFIIPFYALAESTLPAGCQAIPVLGDSLTIKGKKTKVVFIHNIAKTDVWLTHPVKNPGASAGWTSRLQGGNWSALLVNKDPFVLNCIESIPGHEQQIACEGIIAACKWKKGTIPSDNKSTFWVSENLSLNALIAAIGGRGFLVSK